MSSQCLPGRLRSTSGAARKGIGVAITALAALVIASGIERNFPQWRRCERLRKTLPLRRYPVLAGLLTGINVCPPLLLCLAAIAAYGSVMTGAVMGVAFFAGTFPYLVPLLFVGWLGRVRRLRELGQIAMLFAGLWLLANGVSMLVS